jgi:hypothetical protein
MSRFVSSEEEEQSVKQAITDGRAVDLGGVSPCSEMKWTGWRVVFFDGRVYACVVDTAGWVSCMEEIAGDEVGSYCEQDAGAIRTAIAVLANARGGA